MERIIIGVDPHKLSATIEVVDEHEHLLGTGRFSTDRAGYASMLRYVKAWPERVWAVEGANGAGRPLAQRLLEAGEHVVDVPAKLAARVRLFDTGHNRKTDALRCALDRGRRGAHRDLAGAAGRWGAGGVADAHRPPRSTDPAAGSDRQPAPSVTWLNCCLARPNATSPPVRRRPAGHRPASRYRWEDRRRIADEELTELVAVEAKIKKATAELKAIVLARGSTPDGPARCRPGGGRPGPGRCR